MVNAPVTSELLPEQRRDNAKLFVSDTLVRNLSITEHQKNTLKDALSFTWEGVDVSSTLNPDQVPIAKLEFPQGDMLNDYKGGSDDILRQWKVLPENAQSRFGTEAHKAEFDKLLGQKNLVRVVEGIDAGLTEVFRKGIPDQGIALRNKKNV